MRFPLLPFPFSNFARFFHCYKFSDYRPDALGPQGYSAFQASQNLEIVVEKVRILSASKKRRPRRSNFSVLSKLMTPVKPMLAEPGRSADAIISKTSALDDALVEMKYDG